MLYSDSGKQLLVPLQI